MPPFAFSVLGDEPELNAPFRGGSSAAAYWCRHRSGTGADPLHQKGDEMPPLLMTTLFSIMLNLLVPHSNVALPHVSKIDNVVSEISFD